MPCDSIVLNQVEVGKMNPVLLGRALGLRSAYVNGQYFTWQGVQCRIVNGKLIVPEGSEHLADELKRAYSTEVLKYTAQRHGWKMKATAKPNVYEFTK